MLRNTHPVLHTSPSRNDKRSARHFFGSAKLPGVVQKSVGSQPDPPGMQANPPWGSLQPHVKMHTALCADTCKPYVGECMQALPRNTCTLYMVTNRTLPEGT